MKEQHSGILPVTHLQWEWIELVEQTELVSLDLHKQTSHSNVHANLGGKLDKEVVICSKGADADTLANGGGKSFDLIEAAVQFVQTRQPDTWEDLNILTVYYL